MTVYEFLVPASWVALAIYLLWYLLLTDRDTILAYAETFGRPVSCFRGQVVWVTGASTGLGAAMAHELASAGAKLVLSARNEDLLLKVKEECIEASDGKLEKNDILVIPFDMSDLDSHQTHVENAINHFGQVDVLVSNAARYQLGSISTTEMAVIKELFDVNFFGGVNFTKILLNHFLEKGRGHIVVVSSIAGKFGIPSTAAYVATKHALQGFYDTLRMEYHKDNINVTIVNPGIFRSSMFSRTMGSKKNEAFAKPLDKYECQQMSAARCAHLALVAAANKLFEGWIAYHPFLFMLWASQYFPDMYKYIMVMKIYTKKRVSSLIDGAWPKDLPVWKPLFR